MPVLVNFKKCDNAQECNGIEVCSTGALSWDDKKKTIVIDNDKCTSCKKCEKACMVDAIKVASTKEEYDRLKKEIEKDPRRSRDLYIDRYGAEPIHPGFIIDEDKFQTEVFEAHQLTVAEVFNDDSIMCLLASVPIKELLTDKIKYRKVNLTSDKLKKKYEIKELPALLFFKEGKLLGKVEGVYDDRKREEKKKLIKAVKNIINKN
ncbi:4Fe-4S dicluster domain-containing protein [Patescibacteria group bacterium]